MAKGFGELYKLRGIITYSLSPYEQRAFAFAFTKGITNTLRRFRENIFLIGPPFLIGYITYDQLAKEHARSIRKNPADYENDQ